MDATVLTARDTNSALLAQGIEVLELLTPDQYAHTEPGHSPIGAHVRHVLDHYDCLLAGLDTDIVDYDARERDPVTERDPDRAGERLRAVVAQLEALPETTPDTPLRVNAASGVHGDLPPAWTSTTLTRELGFLSSHTVHHYALVRLLAERLGVVLDPSFGVAPATLAHRRRA